MNDHAALLAAIAADPADVLAKLAFADWLEENGDLRRADFIRLSLNRPPVAFHPDPAVMALREYDRLVKGLPFKDARLRTRVEDGFVVEVFCTLAEWEKHGRDVVLVHPLRFVHITGLNPADTPQWFRDWCKRIASGLEPAPPVGRGTLASAVCLAWARDLPVA